MGYSKCGLITARDANSGNFYLSLYSHLSYICLPFFYMAFVFCFCSQINKEAWLLLIASSRLIPSLLCHFGKRSINDMHFWSLNTLKNPVQDVVLCPPNPSFLLSVWVFIKEKKTNLSGGWFLFWFGFVLLVIISAFETSLGMFC